MGGDPITFKELSSLSTISVLGFVKVRGTSVTTSVDD